MPLNPRPSYNQAPADHEKEPDHTLSESLQSFEGTPAEEFIIKALLAKNIDPRTYRLQDGFLSIHNNYLGLPSTGPAHSQPDELSPIVSAIFEGLQDETIIDEQIRFDENYARVNENSPNQFLNRLHLIDTSILRDAKTGEAIAYTTGLTADGGRQDYVICSTKDLDILDK